MILIAASTIRQAALVAQWVGDGIGWKWVHRPDDLRGIRSQTLYLALPVLGVGDTAFWEMLELARANQLKVVEIQT